MEVFKRKSGIFFIHCVGTVKGRFSSALNVCAFRALLGFGVSCEPDKKMIDIKIYLCDVNE